MNKPLTASLIAVVAIGALAYVEESRIAELNKSVATHQANAQQLNGKISALNSELDELRQKLEVFKAESEELRNKLATAKTAPNSEQGTPGSPESANKGEPKNQWMKGIAKMFTDPEMKKSMRAQQLMGIRMIYSDLGKELGLSPQETEQLMEILVDRQMDQAAAGMKAMDPNSPTKSEDAAKLAENNKRYDDQLKAMLGEDKYGKLKSYESSMGDRFMLQQFEGQFNASGAPLEGPQKQQLLSLMREERAKTPDQFNVSNRGNPAQQMEALKSDSNIDQYISSQQDFQRRVLDRSRQFLSADQIAAFEKVQQQQLDMIKMQMKMSREMLGIGK